ncbi:MAG: hypothetical protein U0Y96_02370 [Candidatus Kapaibacterium sp.]|nr:hypothetical protein [Bacteroidota bacterium]
MKTIGTVQMLCFTILITVQCSSQLQCKSTEQCTYTATKSIRVLVVAQSAYKREQVLRKVYSIIGDRVLSQANEIIIDSCASVSGSVELVQYQGKSEALSLLNRRFLMDVQPSVILINEKNEVKAILKGNDVSNELQNALEFSVKNGNIASTYREFILRNIVSRNPENADAWGDLGSEINSPTRYTEAISCWQKSLQLGLYSSNDSLCVMNNIGDAYMQNTNNYFEAIRMYSLADEVAASLWEKARLAIRKAIAYSLAHKEAESKSELNKYKQYTTVMQLTPESTNVLLEDIPSVDVVKSMVSTVNGKIGL